MGYHLRLTAGSTGEVHNHGIVIVIDEGWLLEFRRLLPLGLPVVETFFVAQCDILLHRWTLWHGQLNLTDDVVIVSTDDGFHRGASVTIDVVVLGQHVCSGNDNGANLTQCQHNNPPLIMTLQNKHHGVVLADAQRCQVTGGLVSLLFQLTIGGANLLALVVGP